MKSSCLAAILSLVVLIGGIALFSLKQGESVDHLDMSDFVSALRDHDVVSATWARTNVRGVMRDGRVFVVRVPSIDGDGSRPLIQELTQSGSHWKIEPATSEELMTGVVSMVVLPLGAFAMIYALVLRQKRP